jgi:formate hydrogenlyase transcriptional activator
MPSPDSAADFFRAATLAICGDLRIERAMRDCVRAIRDRVPVDRLFLQVYDTRLGAMRTLASATAQVGEELDLLTPMPAEARDVVVRHMAQLREPFVAIGSPERNPVAREMLRVHGIEDSSLLQMTLATSEGGVGGVVFTAKGPDRYAPEHVELVRELNGPFTVALSNTLQHRELLRLRDRLADDNLYLHRELQRIAGDSIVGADFGLKGVMAMVRQVAPTESPVLLTGETGVGKDVIANALHLGSPRRDGPFIAVNCGAIPETLLDSELFGHEKGAFTGALGRKRGRFERAHGGTIFLDEIGDMPGTAQVRLLRVLQSREIERVGGAERIPVDIRVVAATNRDLRARVEAGLFREDLWFRLAVFPIEIPPLRDRTCDIPALVQHFVEHKARELKRGDTPTLAAGEIEELIAYPWPGNVRELANLVERAMILHRGEPLRFDLGRGPRPSPAVEVGSDPERALASLDAVIEQHIRRALERCGGQVHGPDGAGALLGINPNTLRGKMRKYSIPFGQTRSQTG